MSDKPILSVKVDPSFLTKLDAIAEEMCSTRSQIVRKLIKDFLVAKEAEKNNV